MVEFNIYNFCYEANKSTKKRFDKDFSCFEFVHLYPLIDKDNGYRGDFVYEKGMIKAKVKTDLPEKEAREKAKNFLKKRGYVGKKKPD